MADDTTEINSPVRWLMGLVGLGALAAGAVAVFSTDNGAGSAALIAVGAALLLIGSIGHIRSFKGGGLEADFSRAEEAAEDLATIGSSVGTLASRADADGNERLAGVARASSTGIGKLSAKLKHTADTRIVREEPRRPAGELRNIARKAELELSRLIQAWIGSASQDSPSGVDLEVRSKSTGYRWDMALRWTEPDLLLFIDVKVIFPESMSVLRRRMREPLERAAYEMLSPDPVDKAVLIVFVTPDFDEEEVDVGQNPPVGITTVVWDGASDVVIRAIEQIRQEA